MIRRVIDIVVSAVVLMLLSPLFVAILIAIQIDSPGGAIYRAWRVGEDGRRFRMIKFRSMFVGADRHGPAVTRSGDDRITRVGHFLRATKLDEVPQFWNVLAGDMTLVGPRPEAPEIVEQYTPEQARILSVKPGLTGPGAIACSIDESMAVQGADGAERYYIDHVLDRRLALDADYVRSRNAFTDLALIGKTCQLMLRALTRKPA
jgi:lipopolysaccharide/colanic/teichoic acid biosynthesis glycosyltransferase